MRRSRLSRLIFKYMKVGRGNGGKDKEHGERKGGCEAYSNVIRFNHKFYFYFVLL